MKAPYLIIFGLALVTRSFAADLSPNLDNNQHPIADANLDHHQMALSDKERASLELAKQWLNTPEKPRLSEDGKVTFLYGSTMPTLFASPFYTSDIELEPGERVRDVNLGDTVRWVATPATSGPDDALSTHVQVKPKDSGLTTTLVITTDRRTYFIMLKSSEEQWTPRLAFEYPASITKAWSAYHANLPKVQEPRFIPETHQDMSALDFSYELKGDAPWKPVRVYNDGVKTYIQMPKSMSQTEAPALLVMGGDNKEQLVNYRLVNDRYTVDQIFSKAELVAGVGRKQTKIQITKTSQ
jgi:type IV secretion system protein VirB9